MKIFILSILFSLSLVSSCQNSESFLALRLTDALYDLFQSKGVTKLETKPEVCDCGIDIVSKFTIVVEQREAYDSLILEDLIDEEVVQYIINKYTKKINKIGPPTFKEVWIETNIKQKSNRFTFLRWKRKVKYNLVVDIRWKPNK